MRLQLAAYYLSQMEMCASKSDVESRHGEADDILVEILSSLISSSRIHNTAKANLHQAIKVYCDMDKWYA